MNELDIVDADIVPQRASDDTVIQVHLRELPREDEPPLPGLQVGPSAMDKAMAFHRLQEAENAKSDRPFDWFDWLAGLLKAQGRKDVDTYKELIAMGERRGFFG